jgi:hypothetical protein
MGYTHYWNSKGFTDEQWEEACARAKSILQFTDIPVQWECDVEAPPEVSHEMIRFNGVGDDGHETFIVTPTQSGEFCKTARKPYDEVVVAMLTMLEDVNPNFSFRKSDGDEEDHRAGINLYRNAL